MPSGIEKVDIVQPDPGAIHEELAGPGGNGDLVPSANCVFRTTINTTTVIQKQLGCNPEIESLISKLRTSEDESAPTILAKIRTADNASVKMDRATFSSAKQEIQRIESQISTYYQLTQLEVHPYIATLIGYNYTISKGYSIFIEYIGNGNLDQYLARHRVFLSERFTIINSAATALESLHSCGYVHLDLKPANILLTTDLKVKLCDFEQTSLTYNRNRQTGCSPGYHPPEYDPNIMTVEPPLDIYSFGMVMWRILTNDSLPDSLLEDYHSLIMRGFRPLIPDKYEPEFGNMIEKCWHQNPRKRSTMNTIKETTQLLFDLSIGNAADSLFAKRARRPAPSHNTILEFNPDFYIYDLLTRSCEGADDSIWPTRSEKYIYMRRKLREQFETTLADNSRRQTNPPNQNTLPQIIFMSSIPEVKILMGKIQQQIKILSDNIHEPFPDEVNYRNGMLDGLINPITEILSNIQNEASNHAGNGIYENSSTLTEKEAIEGINRLEIYRSKLIVLQAALMALSWQNKEYLFAALNQETKYNEQRNGSVVGLFTTSWSGNKTYRLIEKTKIELGKMRKVHGASY